MYTYEYPRPSVTADIVVIRSGRFNPGISLDILLIERGIEPYKRYWSLPGGHVDMDEYIADAAARELKEETGLDNIRLYPLNVYDAPDRDPRGRTITVAYMAIISNNKDIDICAGDDASNVKWFNLSEIQQMPFGLAFDHDKIVDDAVQIFYSGWHK